MRVLPLLPTLASFKAYHLRLSEAKRRPVQLALLILFMEILAQRIAEASTGTPVLTALKPRLLAPGQAVLPTHTLQGVERPILLDRPALEEHMIPGSRVTLCTLSNSTTTHEPSGSSASHIYSVSTRSDELSASGSGSSNGPSSSQSGSRPSQSSSVSGSHYRSSRQASYASPGSSTMSQGPSQTQGPGPTSKSISSGRRSGSGGTITSAVSMLTSTGQYSYLGAFTQIGSVIVVTYGRYTETYSRETYSDLRTRSSHSDKRSSTPLAIIPALPHQLRTSSSPLHLDPASTQTQTIQRHSHVPRE